MKKQSCAYGLVLLVAIVCSLQYAILQELCLQDEEQSLYTVKPAPTLIIDLLVTWKHMWMNIMNFTNVKAFYEIKTKRTIWPHGAFNPKVFIARDELHFKKIKIHVILQGNINIIQPATWAVESQCISLCMCVCVCGRVSFSLCVPPLPKLLHRLLVQR